MSFLLSRIAIAAAIVSIPLTAWAQTETPDGYPKRPIQIVVPFGPGGTGDVTARIVGDRLTAMIGQPVVIDNKAGANGIIGTQYASKRPPDGYTLAIASSGTMVMNSAMYTDLPYAVKDFTPIVMVGAFPIVLMIDSKLPIQSVQQFIDYTKANPDKANVSIPASPFLLATELFKSLTGVPLVRIAYRSGAEAMTAVAGGQVMMTWGGGGPTMSFLQSGKLRALAVGGDKRMSDLPDVPTFAEVGYPQMKMMLWSGLVAPAGTPGTIVKKLESAILAMSQEPAFQARLKATGAEPIVLGSDAFRRILDDEVPLWTNVATKAKVRTAR
jgi:tripartite-type tricarboxylate transporter receptor subunit TctC